MKLVGQVTLAWIIFLALVAAHQLLALMFTVHGWKFLSAGDWGTWAQAVFATFAIALTIRLARQDRREKNDSDHARAVITAARLLFPMAVVLARLRSAQELVHSQLTIDQGRDLFAKLRADLADLERIESDDLLALVPLPHQCAVRCANAMSRIRASEIKLDQLLGSTKNLTNHEERYHEASRLSLMLNEAVKYLDQAVTQLQLSSFGKARPFDTIP